CPCVCVCVLVPVPCGFTQSAGANHASPAKYHLGWPAATSHLERQPKRDPGRSRATAVQARGRDRAGSNERRGSVILFVVTLFSVPQLTPPAPGAHLTRSLVWYLKLYVGKFSVAILHPASISPSVRAVRWTAPNLQVAPALVRSAAG